MRKYSPNSRSYQILKKLHEDGKITTLSQKATAKIDNTIDEAFYAIKADARNLERKSEAIVRQQNNTIKNIVDIE